MARDPGTTTDALAGGAPTGAGGRSKRSKHDAILAAAVQAFGQNGYEATKWSDVADQVGIRQTALYHYFDSKAHCLFTIMRAQLTHDLERFREVTSAETDTVAALREVISLALDVDDQESQRLRILAANLSLLSGSRSLPAEEAERRVARQLTQDVEEAWAELLARGMDEGRVPRRSSRQLARAVLGLITSVWRWYRPGGGISSREMTAFYTDCVLRMVTGSPHGGETDGASAMRRRR